MLASAQGGSLVVLAELGALRDGCVVARARGGRVAAAARAVRVEQRVHEVREVRGRVARGRRRREAARGSQTLLAGSLGDRDGGRGGRHNVRMQCCAVVTRAEAVAVLMYERDETGDAVSSRRDNEECWDVGDRGQERGGLYRIAAAIVWLGERLMSVAKIG